MNRKEVTKLLKCDEVKVAFDLAQIVLAPVLPNFRFQKITHLAGLVTGLYNIDITREYPANIPIVGERRIFDYANKLYLVSKQR